MAKAKSEQPEIKHPKGEDACVTCCGKDHKPLFLITKKPLMETFFLYEFTRDGLVKLGKGKSPLELEEKFNVRKRMGVDDRL